VSAKAAAAQLALAYEDACGGYMYSGQQLTAGCDPHAVAGGADEATFLFIDGEGQPMVATIIPAPDR
jgi:hypothetical protein